MPVQKIGSVKVTGMAAAVPSRVVEIGTWNSLKSEAERTRYIEQVGIERLHRHAGNLCCSDLCQKSAEMLIDKLGWSAQDIDLLVYAAVARDYVQPPTACVLHGKMGLKKDCACFDIPQGCSGWAYGMAVACGMMQGGGIRRALLLAGDAEPMGQEFPTRSDMPMFGDAGTATALEYDDAAPPMLVCTQTDGSGYEAIIRRDGGDRSPAQASSLEMFRDKFGHFHRAIDKEMDGPKVFSFSISQVPQFLKRIAGAAGVQIAELDYVILHQANGMINKHLINKLGIPKEKTPSSLRNYGNTSAASIPLTICSQIPPSTWEKEREYSMLACGFGVGFSLGAVLFQFSRPTIFPLIQL